MVHYMGRMALSRNIRTVYFGDLRRISSNFNISPFGKVERPRNDHAPVRAGCRICSDSNGAEIPLIPPDSRDTSIGWRPIETGMLLTQAPGTNITIELDSSADAIETIPMSTFNDLHHGVTIVGHHTSNLFRWTQDFPESILSFTWLVERPEKEGIGWIIPAFAVSMIIAVPASIYFLVKKDGSMMSIGQEE